MEVMALFTSLLAVAGAIAHIRWGGKTNRGKDSPAARDKDVLINEIERTLKQKNNQ